MVLYSRATRHHTLLAFAMSDGSIQFRHRDSMELVSADDNNDEVHTMPQAGFAFPVQDPGWSLLPSDG
jgi:mediator of RNA polymerase II transcription subunit 16